MGYSHYFYTCEPTKKLSEESFKIVKEIIEEYEKEGIVQVISNVFGERLLTPENITFNGTGYETCEHFKYCIGEWHTYFREDRLGFNSVKTNRCDYDECVMDVLLVLSHFDNNIYLSSDGDDEWLLAFERIEKKYGFNLFEQRQMIFGVLEDIPDIMNRDRKLEYFKGRLSEFPESYYEPARCRATKHLSLEEKLKIINDETKKLVSPEFEWDTWIEDDQIEVKHTKEPAKSNVQDFYNVFSDVAYNYTGRWRFYPCLL